MPKIRAIYDGDLISRQAGRLVCESLSRVKQAMGEECDINAIMRRYAKTGILPQVAQSGVFADVSSASVDYGEACRIVEEAEASFASLPADLREHFGNNPGNLLAFLADSDNREEAVKLGLLEPLVAASVVAVPPVVVPPVV